jgi:hypothetical protein
MVLSSMISRCMIRTKPLVIAAFAAVMGGFSASAQDVQHLSITVKGGMPGLPVITGISPVTNGVKVTWDGPQGYYQLFESARMNGPWLPVGGNDNLARYAIVTGHYTNDFYKISGPAPHYAGLQACEECHSPIVATVVQTPHAAAFANARFVADGGQTNDSCVVCHTVGAGLPTGFVSEEETPHLTGVQCENCHGPAANHAANPDDPAVRPQADIAATVCGGCHDDPRHPTFDEWKTSAHSQVVEDFNAPTQIDSCGRCHSGSVRLSLLEGNPLPAGDADIGIVCATCHEPHQITSNPAQLRNPVASTNDYFMSTNGTFASQYNPKVNVCAQCHNHAGASWTNTVGEPHHSPQYNMLLGTIGEVESGLPPYQPGSHALLITNQCAGCHMQKSPFLSAAQPAVTGHSFEVTTYNVCLNCHPLPQGLATFAMTTVSNQIQQIKSDLDYWATNKAPASLAKYGTLAWEYTTPGGLSSGGPGPNASEQSQIPVNIQKARFNLYVVLNDGSFGVHNPIYTVTLLDTAENWIQDELDP